MSGPDIGQAEIDAVVEVLRSGVLSLGPSVRAFESAFAESVGAEHAVAVSSGTAGLHLALMAAGIDRGCAVVTTPFSFVASANVILHVDAVPLFVDVDAETGNIDLDAAREIVGGGDARLPAKGFPDAPIPVKALLPVHVFGIPLDAAKLAAAAAETVVIEDACEALGASSRGRHVGTIGRAGVFAFYPNKQMTTGEGGMIVTDDAAVAETCRSLRNQGRDAMDAWLVHSRLGFNYRMTEMSAALGVVQFGRIRELLDKRARVAVWYRARLGQMEGVSVLGAEVPDSERSWFVFVVRFDAEVDRDQVVRDLAEKDIPSRPYFNPIHLQPYMRERFGYQEGDFPNAEALGRSSLALPFSSVMEKDQVDEVVSRLEEALSTQGPGKR